MSNLERKVDCLIRGFLAQDDAQFEDARQELVRLMGDTQQVRKHYRDRIEEILTDMGMRDKLIGRRYTEEAIALKLEKWDIRIWKGIYMTVAEKFGTTPNRVERGIRHAIDTMYDQVEPEILHKYFGNSVGALSGRPTNAELIARLAAIIRKKMEEEAVYA